MEVSALQNPGCSREALQLLGPTASRNLLEMLPRPPAPGFDYITGFACYENPAVIYILNFEKHWLKESSLREVASSTERKRRGCILHRPPNLFLQPRSWYSSR
jgi:hypothetical protein